MNIRRYDVSFTTVIGETTEVSLLEDAEGEYVSYSDHRAEVMRLRRRCAALRLKDVPFILCVNNNLKVARKAFTRIKAYIAKHLEEK